MEEEEGEMVRARRRPRASPVPAELAFRVVSLPALGLACLTYLPALPTTRIARPACPPVPQTARPLRRRKKGGKGRSRHVACLLACLLARGCGGCRKIIGEDFAQTYIHTYMETKCIDSISYPFTYLLAPRLVSGGWLLDRDLCLETKRSEPPPLSDSSSRSRAEWRSLGGERGKLAPCPLTSRPALACGTDCYIRCIRRTNHGKFRGMSHSQTDSGPARLCDRDRVCAGQPTHQSVSRYRRGEDDLIIGRRLGGPESWYLGALQTTHQLSIRLVVNVQWS
ncbi:hypothetical protein GGR56DRAFT_272757 [Xylariaceae sp. FL0804]|nr:hypothetical protein GGR56DRAFT_272757 [Xylariaceae sp. FL0804]